MTTTPLPPAIQPVAWFEYSRKKPTLKRLVFDRTSRRQLRVAGWVSEALIRESDATAARADLEAENKRLREALSGIKHGLEGARVWGGMDWKYNPLHPIKYQPLIAKAAAALKEQP